MTGGGRGAALCTERVWDTYEERNGKRTGESRGGAAVRGAGQQSRDARWENNRAAHIWPALYSLLPFLDSHSFFLSMKKARFGEVRWPRRVGAPGTVRQRRRKGRTPSTAAGRRAPRAAGRRGAGRQRPGEGSA